MLLLLLAAQVAQTAAAPTVAPATAPAPTSFSILQPVASEPCVRGGKANDDIIVCGKPLPSQKLPYPDEVVLNEPKPSNPYLTGAGAMAEADSTPCATVQRGCTTGLDIFGGATQTVRLIQKIVAPDSCCERPGESRDLGMLAGDVAHGVGRMFRKKPDKSGRVAIALDDAPPPKSVILP